MLTRLSTTCRCHGQQGMPSSLYELILRLQFLLFSFLDFPGSATLPETFMSKPPLNHVSAIQCS